MNKILENDNLIARTNGKYIDLTIKASNASISISPVNGTVTAKPVTDNKYLDALKKRGLDASSRVMLGQACIPTKDAETIIAGFVAAAAELAADPKEIMARLIDQRRNMVGRINGLADDDYQAGHRAMQRAVDSGHYAAPKTDNSAKIAELRAELVAFDAAHPEVKTEIEARKQAEIELAQWN